MGRLSVAAYIATVLWFLYEPGWEPVVVFLTTLAGHVHSVKRSASRGSNEPVSTHLPTKADSLPNDESNDKSHVIMLAERFLQVFHSHGIHLNQIPRVVPEGFAISHSDLISTATLIPKISSKLLEWTSSEFGINRSWLESGNTPIYSTRCYYKDELAFLALARKLRDEYGSGFRVYAYKSVAMLNARGGRPQEVNLLLAVPLFTLDDEPIYRYIPTATLWDWGYWRSRYQFKGIARVCSTSLNLYFEGFDLAKDQMAKLASGRLFPHEVVNGVRGGRTWYPEDYGYLPSEGGKAAEAQEAQAILDYIEEQKYEEFLQEVA